MIEMEEKLELVKEGDEWRIFLNWAAGVKIPFQLLSLTQRIWTLPCRRTRWSSNLETSLRFTSK